MKKLFICVFYLCLDSSSEHEIDEPTLSPPQRLSINVSNCDNIQTVTAIRKNECDFEKLPASKMFCPTVHVLDMDSEDPIPFLIDVYKHGMLRKKSTCYLSVIICDYPKLNSVKEQHCCVQKQEKVSLQSGHVALQICFFKPSTYIIGFEVHSIIDSEGNEAIGWDASNYHHELHVTPLDYSSPQLGIPHTQLAKPLTSREYDNITKQFAQYRLSGKRIEVKVFSDYLRLNNPKPDFNILGLIFNAPYRWLVKDPDALESPVLKLKEAVSLCDKEDCHNGSLLRAKAHVFLAQNFQSDDNFEEAKKHIDAAKVSIFFLGLCMERSAVATQVAFWHVDQCYGDMPVKTKCEIEELLSHAIDCGSQLESYEARCFYVLNLINMARLHLDIFYPFRHKRHQHVAAMEPKPCEESLRKAKLYLDKVPEDFLGDTYASLYKVFYNYTLAEYHRHTGSTNDAVHNLQLAKKQLQESNLQMEVLMKAIDIRLAVLTI